MPETGALQAHLEAYRGEGQRTPPTAEKEPREISALEKWLAPLTFMERVSAAFTLSLAEETGGEGFRKNMENWVDYTDVVEAWLPDASKAVKVGLGFTLGVALDPLTYLGIGGLTKAGATAMKTGAKYKVLREVLEGAPGTAKAVEKGGKMWDEVVLPVHQLTRGEQSAEGLRSLFKIRVPFAGAEVTVSEGRHFYKAMEKAGKYLEDKKLVKFGKRTFISDIGNVVADEELRAVKGFADDRLRRTGSGWLERVGTMGKVFKALSRNKEIAKGRTPEQLMSMVGDAVEFGEIRHLDHPELQGFARGLLDLDQDILEAQIKGGVNVKPLMPSERGRIVNHLPHVMSKDGRDFMSMSERVGSPGSKGVYGSSRANELERTMIDRPISNLNTEWAGLQRNIATGESYADAVKAGKYTEPFFYDPLTSLGIEARRASEAIMNEDFMQRMIKHGENVKQIKTFKKFDEDGKQILYQLGKKGKWARAKKGAKVGGDGFGKVRTAGKAAQESIIGKESFGVWEHDDVLRVMNKEIAAELGRTQEVIHSGEALKSLAGLFDTTQNWWKAWTLNVFPSYGFRNLVDDTFRNALVGVGASSYRQSHRLLNSMTAAGGDLSKITDVGDRAILQAAMERGVINSGAWNTEAAEFIEKATRNPFGVDQAKAFRKQLTGGPVSPVSRENVALKMGNKLNQYRENRWRMANFVHQVKDGMKHGYGEALMGSDLATKASSELMQGIFGAARRMVARTNFDYGDLTKTEKALFRRLFPFFSWTRNNLPFQLQQLMDKPGVYVAIDKLRRSWEAVGGETSDQKYLSDFLKSNYPVRVGVDDNGVERYAVFTSFLSAFDLLKFLNPENAGNEMWGMMSPLPKEFLAQIYNYDHFFRQSIQKYPGETQRYVNIVMPKRLAHGLRNIRVLGEADKIIKSFTDDFNVSPMVAGVRFFTGFKQYPQDPARGMAHYEFELAKAMSQRKAALRRVVKLANSGRMDAKHAQKQAEKLIKQIEELRLRPERIEIY